MSGYDAKDIRQAVEPEPGGEMRYRKKPVVIDAVQFTEQIPLPTGVYREDGAWFVKTLEGIHEVTVGDWIITGVKGERYPCKPDIFALTYEKA